MKQTFLELSKYKHHRDAGLRVVNFRDYNNLLLLDIGKDKDHWVGERKLGKIRKQLENLVPQNSWAIISFYKSNYEINSVVRTSIAKYSLSDIDIDRLAGAYNYTLLKLESEELAILVKMQIEPIVNRIEKFTPRY